MAKWKATERQKKFIDEYLICLNATEAAKSAGYSEKTAYSMGQQLLKKLEIQEEIQKRQKVLQEKTNITQERVLAEYARIAFFDVRGLYGEDGLLKPVKDLDEDTAAAIAGVDIQTSASFSTVQKYKTASKIQALDSLAKHLGMFKESTQEIHKDDPTGLLSALEQSEKEVWNDKDVSESVEETEADTDLVAESQTK